MQAGFTQVDRRVIAPLFAGMWQARGMIEAGLSGMGRAWADNPVHPQSAMLAVGDFLLCAGACGREAAHQLRAWLREEREWLVIAPEAWHAFVGPHTLHQRWAFAHDHQPEDEHLRHMAASLPEDMTFQPLTGEWIEWCRQEAWSRDFVSLFTREEYEARGLGVLILNGGQPVAGAGSYAVYPGGLEVQVQTQEGWEGRGLATIASAQMILMAHERGLKATWDAHNPASARIAQKLGYRLLDVYTAAET